MVRITFDSFLKSLSAFFERKVQPLPATTDLWFEKVKHIPDECLKWIENKIQSECEHWPHNITQTMCDYHRAWIESNPNKRAPERHWDCPHCDQGLITATKVADNGVKYRYVFKCIVCKQLRLDYPMTSKAELERQGFEVR